VKPSLIDTDIFSFMLKKEKVVLENVERYLKEFKRLNISVITYYEVLSGLKYVGATSKLARLDYFVTKKKSLIKRNTSDYLLLESTFQRMTNHLSPPYSEALLPSLHVPSEVLFLF
jgi:tRNA(fMet)-specific endonuclease VapC